MANFRKIRLKDLLNPTKWAAVADAYAKKFQGVSLELCEEVDFLQHTDKELAHDLAASKGVTIPYCEMVVYRASKCGDCVANGSCLHCGCSCPANMLARGNSCSKDKWKSVRNDDEWKQFKKKNNIQ
jgi:hypothetical protein